jgi:hypothetical protein
MSDASLVLRALHGDLNLKAFPKRLLQGGLQIRRRLLVTDQIVADVRPEKGGRRLTLGSQELVAAGPSLRSFGEGSVWEGSIKFSMMS